MKQTIIATILLLLAITNAKAQERTYSVTLYSQFKPSTITLTDGRQLRQPLTNVFLKNSSLLYMSGSYTMEANMDNVVAVKFDDRSFVAINKQLAYLIDSVGTNALFCIELFDQDTYERNLRNNINISSLDLGDQISTSTIDLNNEEDHKLPVFRHYYMRIDGEFIRVHERDLSRRLSKDQRTMMRRVMGLPNFSWQDEESLKTLLRVITHPEE